MMIFSFSPHSGEKVARKRRMRGQRSDNPPERPHLTLDRYARSAFSLHKEPGEGTSLGLLGAMSRCGKASGYNSGPFARLPSCLEISRRIKRLPSSPRASRPSSVITEWTVS
jgi:hypothetical protein